MKVSEIESLHSEGSRGIEDLARLARELGYDTYPQQLILNNGCSVSGILNMLEDNPGMVEAMYNFVIEHAHLYDALEKEEEEDGED